MRGKIGVAVLLSCLLLASAKVSFQEVRADSPNPIVFSGGITIYSPVNTTYPTDTLPLNLTCNCGAGVKINFSYDLDGRYQGPITLTFNVTPTFHMFALGSALLQLPRLTEGSHRLTVYEDAYLNDYYGANPPGAPFKPTAPGSADYVASWVDIVYFTVNSGESPPGFIRITPDGSVVGTSLLLRSGNMYTFAGNISGGIAVEKDGIILDGAGFTLQGPGRESLSAGGLFLDYRENVVVKNLRIADSPLGIGNQFGNCAFEGNYITNCERISLIGPYSNNNTFRGNTIESPVAFNYGAGGNQFYGNNFVGGGYVADGFAAGSNTFDGNYWMVFDAASGSWKPYNGTDADKDGFGDEPYVAYGENVDNHPLMKAIASKWLPASSSLSFEEAIEAVEKADYNLWNVGMGQTDNASQIDFVSESGITGYLMWIAPNGTYYKAEYPIGKPLYAIGFMRGNHTWNPPEGFYVWRLSYGGGEAYWVLAHNGTIVKFYPFRGSGPEPPLTSETAGYALAAAVIVAMMGLGALVYFRKRGKRAH